jgi:hypothetical protein
MTQLPSQFKCCATCEKWAGQRKVDISRIYSIFSNPNDKGECIGGTFNRQLVTAQATCPTWTKWAILQ